MTFLIDSDLIYISPVYASDKYPKKEKEVQLQKDVKTSWVKLFSISSTAANLDEATYMGQESGKPFRTEWP